MHSQGSAVSMFYKWLPSLQSGINTKDKPTKFNPQKSNPKKLPKENNTQHQLITLDQTFLTHQVRVQVLLLS